MHPKQCSPSYVHHRDAVAKPPLNRGSDPIERTIVAQTLDLFILKIADERDPAPLGQGRE